MNACKVLELATINDIAQLIELAKQEITEKTMKEKHGASELKRFKLILKYFKGNAKDIFYKPQYSKAWFEDNLQCFSNGYTGFMLENHVENLPTNSSIAFSLKELFTKRICMQNMEEIELDVPDIKAKIKLYKAETKGIKNCLPCPYDIKQVRYNAQYLLDCYDILGGKDIKFWQHKTSEISEAFFKSENGIAIILPCKKPKTESKQNN